MRKTSKIYVQQDHHFFADDDQLWLVTEKSVEADFIDERSVGRLAELHDLLTSIINSDSDLGLIDALSSSPRWDEVRHLAAECILTLK